MTFAREDDFDEPLIEMLKKRLGEQAAQLPNRRGPAQKAAILFGNLVVLITLKMRCVVLLW